MTTENIINSLRADLSNLDLYPYDKPEERAKAEQWNKSLDVVDDLMSVMQAQRVDAVTAQQSVEILLATLVIQVPEADRNDAFGSLQRNVMNMLPLFAPIWNEFQDFKRRMRGAIDQATADLEKEIIDADTPEGRALLRELGIDPDLMIESINEALARTDTDKKKDH